MCTDVNRQKRPIHTSASESDSGSNSDTKHNSKGYTKHKVARKKKTAFPHLPPLASLASAYSQPAPLSAASNSLPRPPAPCPPCAQPPLAAPDCQPSVTPPTESSLPGYIFSNFQCQVNSIFLNKNTVYCET